MEWIRTANIKKYDVISAYKNMNEIDWTKSNFNICKGDIVYIYVGEPYSKIMYKTFCTDDDVKKEHAINDLVYWTNQNEFDQERKKIRLRLEQVNSSNKLSLDNLNKKSW
ncbi:hypothetical protein ACPWSR_16840 [Alloiococcus sp. CFN-8]|uniref:hypothetical protein n=1 Tax=Alloiococcus sp. CFN-8 TaxID=3416081 RepID=UPI003CE93A87